jgi:hypothetical protein
MSQHEDYTVPPGFRVSGADSTKLAPVLIDPGAPATEGDVITRVGDGYAPHAPSEGGSGVAVPLSVTNGDSLEVLAIGEDGGTTHRMTSGESFTVNVAAEDVDHAYNVIDVDESFLKINLSQYFSTQFALQSRGSSDRRLILAGYNSDDEIVIGFATGKVGFFDTPGVTRPEVPASPTVQDVVDALKALGLITQAT